MGIYSISRGSILSGNFQRLYRLWNVSILVLLEVALRPTVAHVFDWEMFVSILVLLEVGLRRLKLSDWRINYDVSILVLLEVALRL